MKILVSNYMCWNKAVIKLHVLAQGGRSLYWGIHLFNVTVKESAGVTSGPYVIVRARDPLQENRPFAKIVQIATGAP